MRGSRTPGSGSDRSRKRRAGLLKRIKAGLNAAMRRKETYILLYCIGDIAQDGQLDGSLINTIAGIIGIDVTAIL